MTDEERIAERQLSRRNFIGVAATGAAALASGGLLSRGTARAFAGVSATPQRGGTLTVGLIGGSSKDTLNGENAVTEADIARCSQLYDTLLDFSSSYKRQLGLAELVEPSKDAKQWTIRVRSGVEFHNGKPLTADDIIYTFQSVTNPKSPGAAASRLSSLERNSMKKLDERTVRLTFTNAYSPFPDTLAENGTSAIRVIPIGFDPQNPVGTGPFMFKSFTPGDRSVFVRNPHYWRSGQPYLDQLVLIDLPDDSARVNALLSGQVDAIAAVPNSQVSIIKQNSKLEVLESTTGSWNPITMRTDIAPFNDVRVRQAFRLMANRPQLVSQVLAGQGAVANDIFGRFDPDYDHALPQHHLDIQQAKSLLKKAGREGMSISFITSPVSIGLVEAAQVFANQAAAAGVKVKVVQTDGSTFFSRYFLKSPLSQSYWATRGYLLQAADSLMPKAPYNETHWHNSKWLKVVQEAYGTTSDARRRELIHAAQKIEWDSGGYINWGWYNKVDAYDKKVQGLVPDRSSFSLGDWRLRQVWLQQ